MYHEIIKKLTNKNIAILGFGREGKSTYHFIRNHFPNIPLTILDQNTITIEDPLVTIISGPNYLENLQDYDLIMKSPGISLKDIDTTKLKGKITSELELTLEVYGKNTIGITGTKGKSTTSSLLYEVIKEQRDNVYLLGNIGIPIFDKIEEFNKDSLLVIEMSSHQLEYIKKSPHIAAILNLYQDHLDHAGSLEHYHKNKMNIFKYQTNEDFSLFAEDNEYLYQQMEEYEYPGQKYPIRFDSIRNKENTTWKKDNQIYWNEELLYTDEERKILGDHNLKNIMFILTICKILGLDLNQAQKTISNFKGLKYRMEYIGTYDDIAYYNDTIATIPAATENAIKTLQNVDTLIFGGLNREIDYSEFVTFLKNSNLKNLICMPTTGTMIGHILEKEASKNIYFVNTLEEAHAIAKKVTEKGKGCLLSPAAASYEYFKNFEEKGKKFAEIVTGKDI